MHMLIATGNGSSGRWTVDVECDEACRRAKVLDSVSVRQVCMEGFYEENRTGNKKKIITQTSTIPIPPDTCFLKNKHSSASVY